jgi:hypothetical protein
VAWEPDWWAGEEHFSRLRRRQQQLFGHLYGIVSEVGLTAGSGYVSGAVFEQSCYNIWEGDIMVADKALVPHDPTEDALSTYVDIGGRCIQFMVDRNALTRIADEAIGTVAASIVSVIKATGDVCVAVVEAVEETRTKIRFMNEYGQIIREELGPSIAASAAAQKALGVARRANLDPPIQQMLEKKIMEKWTTRMNAL